MNYLELIWDKVQSVDPTKSQTALESLDCFENTRTYRSRVHACSPKMQLFYRMVKQVAGHQMNPSTLGEFFYQSHPGSHQDPSAYPERHFCTAI